MIYYKVTSDYGGYIITPKLPFTQNKQKYDSLASLLNKVIQPHKRKNLDIKFEVPPKEKALADLVVSEHNRLI